MSKDSEAAQYGSRAGGTALPPVVYLPCAEYVRDPADAVVEFRQMDDGSVALPAYSALDRLQTCCGEQQPWLLVPTSVLSRLREVQSFQRILLDVTIPPEHRTTPESATTVRHTTA